ncbi:MAG: A/G-specific adenine glycosylase [Oscillospiraceae bacterium]|nr:A/G-specific adenine glycosylase [Oscillospiraceae bacterium]
MDDIEAYSVNLAPTTRLLVDWYRAGHRDLPWRKDPSPYRVWISEIMLQQTRVQAAIPYYHRFLSLFPDVHTLAAAPEDLLLKAWEGLGYYSRARNLQKAARQICENLSGRFPDTYDGWLALPGVGPYTAGAVCSIAFSQPVPAVDGNVLRVFSRLMALEEDISAPAVKKKMTRLVASLLPPDASGDYNQALMELGATLCPPNGAPVCKECPVSAHCRAFQDENQLLFPLKSAKKPRKILPMTVFLLENQGRWALLQRPAKGLLANLWEFPNTDGHLSAREMSSYLEQWIRPAGSPLFLGNAVHIFTHLEWHMSGWRIPVEEILPGCPFTWAEPEEIKHLYAIPSAFSSFLPVCFIKNTL